jgi:hypothetical protein
VICDKKVEWIKINQNNCTQLKFTLCDFMMELVIIHSPKHTQSEVKIKPINSHIIHIWSKYDGHPKASQPSDT